MKEKIKWALKDDYEEKSSWADPIYYRELKQDLVYDECFLQAVSESDMANCHQRYLKDYIAGKREKMIMRCPNCYVQATTEYIHKRAHELYEEKIKNGNTEI